MKIRKIINILLTLTILFTLIYTFLNFNTNITYAENITTTQSSNDENLHLYSDAVILMENKTGKILYEKNSEKKMYPASTTKILTALIAIEKGNLNDKFTVSQSAIAEMKPGYTSAYLVSGEELTIQELLEVLLIRSANDASNVIAEYISGSIEEFVKLMNQKLEEFGCTHSHFVTTNGLHDDNHYTTAKDMAIIARHCMANSTFRKIVSMKSCTIPTTNKSPERIYKNTNDLIIPTSPYYYKSCIGIKTGYTSEAKNCLISACNKNNLQLISVVLGASLTENHKSARYVDSETLFNYGYNNYSFKTIAKSNSVIKKIEVPKATEETKNLDLILEKDITVLINNKDNNNIKTNIILNDNLTAPISKNSVIGKITYTINNDTYESNLLASHNVIKTKKINFNTTNNEISKTFLIIIIILLLLIIILSLTLILIKKHNRNKNN